MSNVVGTRRTLPKNTAITLIALVITVIVLLVLVGVTLNAVLGPNGIIPKASWAKFMNNLFHVEEQEKLVSFEQEVEERTKEGKRYEIADLDTSKVKYKEPEEKAEDKMNSKNTYYKIKGNRLSNKELEKIESLKLTIIEVEKTEDFSDNNEKLQFYEVDKKEIKVDVKEDYIINIASGKVYQYKAHKQNGLTISLLI